jgi:hypothetical protein
MASTITNIIPEAKIFKVSKMANSWQRCVDNLLLHVEDNFSL